MFRTNWFQKCIYTILTLSVVTFVFLPTFISNLPRYFLLHIPYHNYTRNNTKSSTNGFSDFYLSDRRTITSKCKQYAEVPGRGRIDQKKQTEGISTCNNLKPYAMHTWHDIPVFQTVANGELWITSAFFDPRVKTGQVRIIALASWEFISKNPVYCTLWYNKCQRAISMKAIPAGFRHFMPFRHKGHFYTCDTQDNNVPDYISLSTQSCDNPANLLEVKHLMPYVGPTTIAHCLPTIHGLQDPYRITEWLAFQKLLGVDHVYIYDFHSVSQGVLNVINYFRKEGFVSVIGWHMTDQMAVAGFGQRAFLNDCIYRAHGKYKYVLSHDLDELIIPISSPTLKEFVNSKDKQGKTIIIFNTAEFCTNRAEFASSYPSLRTMVFTQRKSPSGKLQKLIAKPESTIEMGVHNVEIKARGANTHMATHNEAIVHHYRFRGEENNHCPTKDTSVFRFKDRLKTQTNEALTSVGLPHIS